MLKTRAGRLWFVNSVKWRNHNSADLYSYVPDDRTTLDALIERLGRDEDPLWLRGDAVGALTELTGQRFAYDFEAWRAWWAAARPGWQPR